MYIGIQLIVMIIGILMWSLCTNTKLAEMGKIAYGCGLLAFLLTGAEVAIKFLNNR